MMSRARSMELMFSLVVLLGSGQTYLSAAPMGTAFTYQGRFTDGSSPANGSFDFQFSLFDAATAGSQVGSTVTRTALSVSDGYFTTTLDFGSGAFTGNARWLQIAVRPAGQGSYTTLTPRHELTPTPYSLYPSVLGTANYIPKFTSSGLGNSVLYESGGNIGIGTTSPASTLDLGAGQTYVNTNATYQFFGPSAKVIQVRDTSQSAINLISDINTDGGVLGAISFSRSQGQGDAHRNVAGIRGLQSSTGTLAGGRLELWTKPIGNGTTAPRMLIDQNGRVGIGTTSPQASLDIRGSLNVRDGQGAGVISFAASGAYPNLYIRSDDDPSTYEPQSERVFIGSNGKVGIGTTSPSNTLHVSSGTANNISLFESTDPGAVICLKDSNTTNTGEAVCRSANHLDLRTDDVPRLTILASLGYVGIGTGAPTQMLDVSGTVRCVNVVQTSDAQLKTDIQPLGTVLDKLDRIRAVSFRWNEKARSLGAKTDARQIGVLAQELEAVFPELVVTPEPTTVDKLLANYPEEMLTAEVRQRLQQDADKTRYKAVNYGELTAVLLEAVKELRAQNRSLEQRVQALESKVK